MSVSMSLRRTLLHSFLRRSFRASVIETKLHLYSRPLDQASFLNTLSCSGPTPSPVSILRKFYSTSTDVRKESLSLQIDEGGQVLNLSWNEDNAVSLYAVWLRHNCQCPECLADNGQCLVVPQLLDPSITVDSADISGK